MTRSNRPPVRPRTDPRLIRLQRRLDQLEQASALLSILATLLAVFCTVALLAG